MCWLCNFLNSSIGRKMFVALAGLLLMGFLVTHLAGNLLIYAGEGAFNQYAAALEANEGLLVVAEIGLVALFLGHIVLSLWSRRQSAAARPVGYEMQVSKGGRTLPSRTMLISGLLTLAFLVVHIKTFKFGAKPDGLFRLVMDWFANPLYSGFYVVAMGALCLHLSHGFQSAFQTLGVSHPKYTPLIRKAGYGLALILAAGFASLPLYGLMAGGR